MARSAPTPDSGRPPLPKGAWLAVGLLWFAGGSNYMTRTMLTTMRGSIIHALPMSDAQFALLTTAFLWPYALIGPFGGFIADRFDRKRVVILSLVGWSATTLVTAQVHTFTQFLVLRSVLGICQACYVPAAVAMVIDFHRGPTRGLASGIHISGMVIGSAVGGLGGWIAERQGWTFAYTAVAIPSLLLSGVLILFLRNPPREHLETTVAGSAEAAVDLGPALRSLFRPGPFYWLGLCMIIQGAVSWIIIGWMPTVTREQFHLHQGAAGFSTLGFLYVFQTIGLLAGGYWSDRWSARDALSRITLPAYAILVAAPVFWLTGWVPHLSVTFVGLGMWGLAMGILGANSMPITCLVVDPRYRATATGLLNGVTAIAGGVAIYAVGALRDAGMGVSFIMTFTGIGVLFCGYALWLVYAGLRRPGRKMAATN